MSTHETLTETTVAPYLDVARSVASTNTFEKSSIDFPTPSLSPPNLEMLHKIGEAAFRLSWSEPKIGWALMKVTDELVQNSDDLFLKSLTAWHLGRAANGWFRPDLVRGPLERAKVGFETLGQADWLAACRWQRYAVPWMWEDFNRSNQELLQAYEGLCQSTLSYFAPYCQLSVAYSYLLLGKFELSLAQLALAEVYFVESQLDFGLAYAWFIRTGCLRRSSQFAFAATYNQKAKTLFEQIHASVYTALTHFNFAYITLISKGNYAHAETEFKMARDQFELLEIILWSSQCDGGLAQVFIHQGKLKDAEKLNEKSRKVYRALMQMGVLADSLLNSGQQALFKGSYEQSHFFLEQAKDLYKKNGNSWGGFIALMHQGEVCLQQGRFYDALTWLEEVVEYFAIYGPTHRLADCEWRLALVWVRLGRFDLADRYLVQAAQHYGECDHIGNSYDIAIYHAELLSKRSLFAESKQLMQKIIQDSQDQANIRMKKAKVCLAKALSELDELTEAETHLREAYSFFSRANLSYEKGECEILQGQLKVKQGKADEAQAAYQQALQTCEGNFPEVAWQARFYLADLALSPASALEHYRLGMEALSQVRRQIWQPAVVAPYLSGLTPLINKAVFCAFELEAVEDALFFIEEFKAQTLSRQLTGGRRGGQSEETEEMAELMGKINWLRQKRFGLNQSNQHRTDDYVKTHQELLSHIKMRADLTGQMERKANFSQPESRTGF